MFYGTIISYDGTMAVAGEAVTGELTATTGDSDVGGTEDSSSSVSTVSLLFFCEHNMRIIGSILKA